MKLRDLVKKVEDYDNKKGWLKRFGIKNDAEQIMYLKQFITSLQIAKYSGNEDVPLSEFINFLKSIEIKEDLISEKFLKGGSESATIFNEWLVADLKESTRTIKINLPETKLNLIISDFSFNELWSSKLTNFDLNNSVGKLSKIVFDEIAAKQKEENVNSFLIDDKFKEIKSKINFNSKELLLDIKIRKKALKDKEAYHPKFLVELGFKVLSALNVLTIDQYSKIKYRDLCISLGKAFIHYLATHELNIDSNSISCLQILIERKFSCDYLYVAQIDKIMVKFNFDEVKSYLINKLQEDVWSPFTFMLEVAELFNPINIKNPRKWLIEKFEAENANIDEIVFEIANRFNQADDKCHQEDVLSDNYGFRVL